MVKTITVRKADGTEESFDDEKLRTSLRRSKAKSEVIEEVVKEVTEAFYGKTVPTSQIYRMAFGLLKSKRETTAAARYSLKRAVLDLGPSGFPFEYFLTEIYSKLGYQTETGVIMRGGCATHEVDVLAYNDKEIRTIEAKFHNSLGFKTDLKVMLYVQARMQDLIAGKFDGKMQPGQNGIGMLVTNTSFTTNAIAYAECVGLETISWDYPVKRNLHDMIEDSGLHPLTCLTSLDEGEKKKLLEQGIVLCSMIDDDNEKEKLAEVGVSQERMKEVDEEIKKLCRPEAVNN
jgi:hypothetical protein